MSAFVELFFIIVIIVIVFGASVLPALGEAFGRLIHRRAKRSTAPTVGGPRQSDSASSRKPDDPGET